MTMGGRVAVIGLDCASPDLIFHTWRDDLPTFRRLMTCGRYGRLRSSDPPITIPAWSCMVTGKDPGQLGVYGFRNRKDYSYDDLVIADSTWIREPTLWRVLSRRRLRSIVIGVPQTYPPHPLRGILVSGMLAPNERVQFTYPPEARETLHEATGGYIIDVRDFRTDDKSALLSQIKEMTRRRFRAARHFLTREDWDFFMAVDMGPDRISHGFWKYFDPRHPKYEPDNPYQDAVRDYYRLLDQELGSVWELLDPQDTLIVVSDHGARPMMGGFCVNEWLRRRRYLRLRHEPASPVRLTRDMIDWSNTAVWSEGGYYARLYFNIRGREPEGIVEPDDLGRLGADLTAELTELQGPHGALLGNRVLDPREIYREVNRVAPDLMLYPGDLSWRSVGSVGTGDIYTFDNDTGPDDANHDYHGIFMMFDPAGDAPTGEMADMNILDVAPTVLRRLCGDVPEDMRGTVIE